MSVFLSVAAVSAAGVIYTEYRRAPSEEQRIQLLVQAFATAVHAADSTQIAELLCRKEAIKFLAGLPDQKAGPVTEASPSHPPEHGITDLEINGNSATVQITSLSGRAGTLSLRKEKNHWTVCDPT